jgi:hypothetical protein
VTAPLIPAQATADLPGTHKSRYVAMHVAPAAVHTHDHLVAIHDHGVDRVFPDCPDVIGRYCGHTDHVDIALTGQAWCRCSPDADVEILRRVEAVAV